MRAVNLIPAEERRGAGGLAGRTGGVVYVLTGGLALLVVLGVVYALAVHTVANRKSELASLNAQLAAVSTEAESLAPYVQVASVSAAKVQQVATLAQQRFDWPAAMKQLALALPDDVAFQSFTASAAAPGSGSFTLVGCANSQGEVPAVLTALSSVPGVTNVSLTSSIQNADTNFHGQPTKLNHGGGGRAAEPTSAGCPKVTWTIGLTYAASYTVPKVKLPQSSAASAQTVSSAPDGSSSTERTAARRVNP